MSTDLDFGSDPFLRKPTFFLVAIGIVSQLYGCSTMRGGPVRYVNTDAIVASINLTPEDLATLQSSTSVAERNQYQNKAVSVIDQNFNQFVRALVQDRADMAAGAAGITLGAATAGAFVESVKAKTNYALFGAAAIGALGILDKNYYYEKTVPALVSAMGAARANVLVRIRMGQREPITTYDGTSALSDLEDYFSAGTILAAISEITTRADGDKQLALDHVRSLDVPSDDEISRRRRISNAIFAITEEKLDKGNLVLKSLSLKEQSTVRDARLALLRAMRPPTKEQLDKVESALKSNGLLK